MFAGGHTSCCNVSSRSPRVHTVYQSGLSDGIRVAANQAIEDMIWKVMGLYLGVNKRICNHTIAKLNVICVINFLTNKIIILVRYM